MVQNDMSNMNKKITVSIGIPAFNEEENIAHLLTSLRNQKNDGLELVEIVIVSDGSTDKTVERISEINDQRIRILDCKERSGINHAQNVLLDELTGDIVVLLNADIIPQGISYISELVTPLVEEIKNGPHESKNPIGIVAGNYVCVTPKTFVEKILVEAFHMKREVVVSHHNGDNPYMCMGPARAFSRVFTHRFRWKDTRAEDVYSYFSCKKNGFRVAYAPDAKALFKVPSEFGDYVKQSIRYREGREDMKKYFTERNITENFKFPIRKLFISFIKHLVLHPILNVSYALMVAYSYTMHNNKMTSHPVPHETVGSTKRLI
jgi:poly-beta-1,6-N-acetyl-D-glucosamine synthase